jgi:hypothetical protein
MEKQARRASFRHSFFSHLVGLFDWLAAATRLRNDAANFAPRGAQPLVASRMRFWLKVKANCQRAGLQDYLFGARRQ